MAKLTFRKSLERGTTLITMAYTQVVEALGENLASSLELLKKWLGWFGQFKPLLDYFHQLRKEDLMGLVDGTHKIVKFKAVVDLNANPSLPFSGAIIEEHKKGGVVTIVSRSGALFMDGRRVGYAYVADQRGDKTIIGHELRSKFEIEPVIEPVLNACFLDFLMVNQHLVPDHMKMETESHRIRTYFWGTIYRDLKCKLYVRYCYWAEGELHENHKPLDLNWSNTEPAALSRPISY